ncbi:hypothetical protein TMatcc_003509 [Talaromyces marneffei ATCC 18224]|uniref:Uncharacterized protein n=2 Tax=Talaromyces marneffei TaxID=37727 RepID=B6Q408_TALMQ|nr:uncharacterized protein EYB26_001455 [Talaromyces marneffei]EEA28180.1 conserved hypothetical protein [Talaromyces marneffei ATCC 18224]KAE8556176.1 hypothetical protein EYB25_000876 [Talaromyces marneffei]QGA13804.1 hypothetical protein EYB26_001455 [Talaromyces marneffei]
MGDHEDRNTKTNVQGGSSAIPTPANNVSTGSKAGTQHPNQSGNSNSEVGSSDSSYQGPGHTAIPNPAASIGRFLALSDQKGASAAHTKQRIAESSGLVDENLKKSGVEETCETEDHSFMQRKPGGPDMVGHSVIQGIVDRFTK